MSGHLLTTVIFLPLFAALALAAVPKKFTDAIHASGAAAMSLTALLSLLLFSNFQADAPGYQFQEIVPWIRAYGITYQVGIDGISLVLILLTTLLSLAALVSCRHAVQTRHKEFVIALLVLETAMTGAFAALDLFLFYIFWEAMLIPMYFLIGVYGGPRRIYATLKFFLYTMAGSVLMLAGILALYAIHKEQFGFASTALADLYRIRLPLGTQVMFFILFFAAFAVKVPVFPFHTWLPDAHVEAPTAGSVILAGVLLKMGGYGMIRLAIPLFPGAAVVCAPYVATLGVIGIIYGAFVAWAQEDMKKLVAYSSVSHMGFVVLGLASLSPSAMSGAVFQMIAHGVSTGALFLLIGVIYERRHTRMIGDFGGLARVTPRFAAAFLVILLASIGLPGLCGFIGEFLVLSGSAGADALVRPVWFSAFAVTGVVLGAAYMLMLYERVFLGPVRFEENKNLKDLTWREGLSLALPLIFALWLGLRPSTVLSKINPAVNAVAAKVSAEKEASR